MWHYKFTANKHTKISLWLINSNVIYEFSVKYMGESYLMQDMKIRTAVYDHSLSISPISH